MESHKLITTSSNRTYRLNCFELAWVCKAVTKSVIALLVVGLTACRTENVSVVSPLNAAYVGQQMEIDSDVPQMPLKDSAVVITVPETATTIAWDDIVADYHYVALETDSAALIGEVYKLLYDKGLYFVFDKRNQLLRAFHSDGSYARTFGGPGRGPGEYTNVTDVSLDKETARLLVLDAGSKKMISYHYDGTLDDEQPMYYYFDQFERTSGGRLALSASFARNTMLPEADAFRLIVANAAHEPQGVAFPYPYALRNNFHFESLRNFQKTDDGRLYYNYFLSDVVWEVRDTACVARYQFNFPGRGAFVDNKDLPTFTDTDFKRRAQTTCYFSGIYHLNRHFLAAYIFNPSQAVNLLLYDRRSRHVRYGTIGGNTDLRDKLLANHFDAALFSDTFVTVVQPFSLYKLLQDHRQYDIPLTIGDKERPLVDHVVAEDNPVLLVISKGGGIFTARGI